MKVSQKELDELLDCLTNEIDTLKTSHKQEVDTLKAKIKELELKQPKTIIKYVKR